MLSRIHPKCRQLSYSNTLWRCDHSNSFSESGFCYLTHFSGNTIEIISYMIESGCVFDAICLCELGIRSKPCDNHMWLHLIAKITFR